MDRKYRRLFLPVIYTYPIMNVSTRAKALRYVCQSSLNYC